MAQLIEPDGTLGIITTVNDAIAYCSSHSGWSWKYYEEGDII